MGMCSAQLASDTAYGEASEQRCRGLFPLSDRAISFKWLWAVTILPLVKIR